MICEWLKNVGDGIKIMNAITGGNENMQIYILASPLVPSQGEDIIRGLVTKGYIAVYEQITSIQTLFFWMVVTGILIGVVYIVIYFWRWRSQRDLALEEMRGRIKFVNDLFWSRIHRRRGR